MGPEKDGDQQKQARYLLVIRSRANRQIHSSTMGARHVLWHVEAIKIALLAIRLILEFIDWRR
jgi:hypothetical protein